MAKRKWGGETYDKRMYLEQPVEGSATYSGEIPITWSVVAPFWCSLKPIRGREFYQAAQVQSETTHVIRTWYRSDVTIEPEMRFSHNGRYFYVESCVDVDEAHEEFEIRAREKM